MFRKLILSFAFILTCVSVAKADRIFDVIGPSTSAVNSATTNNSSATIAAPGLGFRNCLTSIVMTANYNGTFFIRGGNTNQFVIDVTTSSQYSTSNTSHNTGPVTLKWDPADPFCVDYNTAINLVVSTGSAKINYNGQIRGR